MAEMVVAPFRRACDLIIGRGGSSILYGVLLLCFCVGCLFCLSCSSSREVEYSAVYDFDRDSWSERESVIFGYDSRGVRSGDLDLYVVCRLGRDFEYRDLLLEVRCVDPNHRYWNDTVRVGMAGRCESEQQERRFSAWRDGRFLYRSGVVFPMVGEYSFSIRQLNAPDIVGVQSLGMEIERR